MSVGSTNICALTLRECFSINLYLKRKPHDRLIGSSYVKVLKYNYVQVFLVGGVNYNDPGTD